jgi:hypothetical protein
MQAHANIQGAATAAPILRSITNMIADLSKPIP